ncbi:MAG: UDP-galactopyranose mutase [Methylococcaceae bacterium]|nr:UDP-galactopyranose mutase [Methylococcaceae bacterium]MDZ4156081.1 UDP-galactopyranose mutase [Methylococcales bacterium]MDP2395100.1 UDP-galactopyranose mutase [Methylococcaceae bacterium]MDP3018758.1 UDP-galactopyranose mutase [Methylococcaceae bacterium]MDP3390525.1 UDP-galactopyranose mutase [Methylococcaceae bacterium]
MKYNYLIVGAGFAGAVCAQKLAESGRSVLLIDIRPHIGGNAYDKYDEHGVLIHPYGPHIFHTNSKRIFEYLSLFTDWRFYEHRVLAVLNGETYPIPINRTTINKLYGLDLTEEGVENYLENIRIKKNTIKTSEDVVLNSVGADLCEKFFRSYTKKQWGLDLSELSAGVASRIPTRTNDDDRYFSDTFQFMPSQGYTKMFERMLANKNITVKLSSSLEDAKKTVRWEKMIYTGPIDAYFNYCFGKLPYRSLRFEHLHLPDTQCFQVTGTINYPNEQQFTRITEFKHLTKQQHTGSSIVREYPQEEGDPYYPVPRKKNETLFKRYQALTEQEKNVVFVGRLAQYRYYNMDQVVAAALACAEKIIND